MNWINRIRGMWSKMFLRKEAKEVFNIDIQNTDKIDSYINRWSRITSGEPDWMDNSDDIVSLNLAQFIDDVTSGLVVLDIGISMPDTPRGRQLQKIADYALDRIDERVSSALGNAGIVMKPNEETVDFYYPGSFIITDWNTNGEPTGIMFVTVRWIDERKYTKYEYHRFEKINGIKMYVISNRAYKSKSESARGEPCDLRAVKEWEGLFPDTYIEDVEQPLFVYYGNPKPNFLDRSSPMKIPFWANCLVELEDFDIAWSRKRTEIEDSKHTTFVPEMAIQYAKSQNQKLPRFVKGLQISGNIAETKIHEHVATLLTEQRIEDINSILALISSKLGFDQGFLVLNEKTGAITATQVEADDQSTIRTIKNLRDPLKTSLIKLLYAANVFIDLYTDMPTEDWTANYETFKKEVSDSFSFGDITYNYEEDRASWWKYRIQGDVPAWMYYTKFEGMSEDEAKAMIAEAQPKTPTLFGSEE